MNLLSFMTKYPDEESCKMAFKQYRDQEGVLCKKCGNDAHYWKGDKHLYQCKGCGFRTTLRSGTVMENSHLPFQYWFIAMHLLSSTKKSFSAKEIQSQLGHNRYEPIWTMLHKLRSVMGIRDDRYLLSNQVELDEGFFETVTKEEATKRGRGSQRQTCVMVMAETQQVEEPRNKRPSKKCFHFKMKVATNLKSVNVNQVVKKNIDDKAIVQTDGYRSYNHLEKVVGEHQSIKVPPEEAGKLLPWVHIAISNAKRLLLNTYHRVDGDFLQNYLNEFCFKLNRRYFNNLMDRLLVAAVSYQWDSFGYKSG